ncbi:ABC transporter permease [Ferrimonas sediminicola]|uniref:ABC transporter permease n=1 Tax=Ferrimonas sediminicola TaxID=2569538 RepID=A0A4U1BH96_9GAMM|nr:FtsX-like permease family protein [Ferrimonas sediminicola]TKB50635.1 ABC transporter permease [Ferrimonas sediminicola]
MLIRLAWRNLWRNRLRTGIMLATMVFGLTGVVTLMGFLSGMYANMIDNAIAWQTSHLQVQRAGYRDDPTISLTLVAPGALMDALRSDPRVAAVSPRFLAEGMVASAHSNRGVIIRGVLPEAESGVTPVAGRLTEGAWLDDQGRNPVVLSTRTAHRLKLRLGSKVVLTFTDAGGEVTGAAFRVRGLFRTPSSQFDDNNLYVRQRDLQALAGLQGTHEIAVRLRQEDFRQTRELQGVIGDLRRVSAPANQVMGWRQIQPMLASLLAQSRTSNGIILAIYVAAMGLGILNIMLMSVFERTREFGVLMAVGMHRYRVFMLILTETTLMGVGGCLLGLGLSSALIALLSHTGINLELMSDGLGAFGVDTLLYPRVEPREYLMILTAVVATAILASLYPARQILKQRPVDAMSEKH